MGLIFKAIIFQGTTIFLMISTPKDMIQHFVWGNPLRIDPLHLEALENKRNRIEGSGGSLKNSTKRVADFWSWKAPY